MIPVRSDLDEPDFIALLDAQANVLERSFDRFGKGFSPVLHRTDQVVEKQGLVVTFVDVFTHSPMLSPKAWTPHSECEESWD